MLRGIFKKKKLKRSFPREAENSILSSTSTDELNVTFEVGPGEEVSPSPEDQSRKRPNRTVNDFSSKKELKQALLSDVKGSFHDEVATGCFMSGQDVEQDLLSLHESNDSETDLMKNIDEKLDWVLENYDQNTTREQDFNEELRRLLVLKSYLVLDTERRESFEKITGMASGHFDCPIALISLVDLGRQWFLSNRGLGEVRETPRKLAFCAHAIMSKNDCLVVPDATNDFRFKDSPLVTGPPDIRFYAGAPLLSPEGYKLGTLCVIDTKTRPQGISLEEKKKLKDLAAKTVDALVQHRQMKSVWFENLQKTHFPEFKDTGAPDSSEQESLAKSEEKYNFREDQDVARFLEKTKDMPLKKFLSLLETQAKALNLSTGYLQKYNALTQSEKKIAAVKPRAKDIAPTQVDTTMPAVKQVRFGKHKGRKIESLSKMKELWWSAEELQQIRGEAYMTTQFYRKCRPRYTKSVETVAKSTDSGPAVEHHLMQLMENVNARGLESQIVKLLSGNRKATVQAVLEAQSQSGSSGDSFDAMSDRLRVQSLVFSQLSTRFAEMIARCDHINALRANMPEEQSNSGDSVASGASMPPCNTNASARRRLLNRGRAGGVA